MFPEMEFPFADGRFPDKLGAVIQRNVLEGTAPALYAAHTDDNGWLVGDGKTDPNAPGAVTTAHIGHVVERDPSLEELASLPIGFEAFRTEVGAEWEIRPFTWGAE